MQSAESQTQLITAVSVQQSIYRQLPEFTFGVEGAVRAELLGGDFVVSGPQGYEARPQELLLDSGLGPVCDNDTGSPSRGLSVMGSDAEPAAPIEKTVRKNYALLVATDNYMNWPHLSNPIFDAKTIETDLKAIYGFEVEHLFDSSRQELKAKLDEHHNKHYGPDDQLLIFFAGHGDYDATNDIGYLVFKDSPSRHDYDSDMNLMELRSRIDSIPVKHILLVMDSCFAGSLDPEIGGSGSRGRHPRQPQRAGDHQA